MGRRPNGSFGSKAATRSVAGMGGTLASVVGFFRSHNLIDVQDLRAFLPSLGREPALELARHRIQD